MLNKQAHPRKRGRVRTRYGVEELAHTAFTQNLSLTGAFVRTNRVFRPGTRLRVEFSFEGETISMWAQVVWAKKVPPQLANVVHCGMGIRFVNPAETWAETFERWQDGKSTV